MNCVVDDERLDHLFASCNVSRLHECPGSLQLHLGDIPEEDAMCIHIMLYVCKAAEVLVAVLRQKAVEQAKELIVPRLRVE